MPEVAELSLLLILAIALLAFLTGVLHGATGIAGGVVMASVLSHMIGIKLAVPVMTCALVFSHSSRALIFWRDTDWHTARRVLLIGLPTTVVGAVVFSVLEPATVATVFVLFLTVSFILGVWARRHRIRTGPRLLTGASAIWGLFAGNVIGPGFFLAPFLLGTGMSRMAFAGTLSSVTLFMNIVKLSVFGVTEMVTGELLVLGVFVGLITMPGNWAGSRILRKMNDDTHRRIVDILTVLMIVNFAYLAVAG